MSEEKERAQQLRVELDLVIGQLEQRKREVAKVSWCPHTPTPQQQTFLELTADDALYGGAAGGG